MKDMENIKSALEKRVADLQLKAEKVAILELEKKRFLEKEVHFKEATEKIRQTLEKAENKVKHLEEENTKLKQSLGGEGKSRTKAMNLGSSASGQGNQMREAREHENDEGNRGVAHADVEEYLNIISKLNEENLSTKGSEFGRKIKELDNRMPEFSRCMERFSLKNRVKGSSEMSKDESEKLGQIVHKVAEVKKVFFLVKFGENNFW